MNKIPIGMKKLVKELDVYYRSRSVKITGGTWEISQKEAKIILIAIMKTLPINQYTIHWINWNRYVD